MMTSTGWPDTPPRRVRALRTVRFAASPMNRSRAQRNTRPGHRQEAGQRPSFLSDEVLMRSGSRDDYPDGLPEDAKVKEETLMPEIAQIELDLQTNVFHAGIVLVLDLREPGDSRRHGEPLGVFGNDAAEAFHEKRPFRTRTDERHVAPEHVEELRQLVHARAPQNFSQTCDPVIVL